MVRNHGGGKKMLRKSSVWLVILFVAVAFITTSCTLRLVVNGKKSPVVEAKKEEAKPEAAKETEKLKIQTPGPTEAVPDEKAKEEIKIAPKQEDKAYASKEEVKAVAKEEAKEGIGEEGFKEVNIGDPTGLRVIPLEKVIKEEVKVYAPMEEAKVPEKAPKQEAKQEKPAPLDLTGLRIQFAFDDYSLSIQARENLSKIAAWMSKNPKARILIEGHTCEIGTNEYNMALGEQRANSAKRYLEGLGVPPGRIILTSYGEEKPLDPGHTEEALSKNRRDEFVETK